MVQFLRLLDISPLDILPQRPPFVLIDRLTHYDETSAKTCLTVREDNLFVENGRMLATGLVENMAQTCAARLGYYNLVSGLPVRVGVIGAVSKLHVRREPLTGERLTSRSSPSRSYVISISLPREALSFSLSPPTSSISSPATPVMRSPLFSPASRAGAHTPFSVLTLICSPSPGLSYGTVKPCCPLCEAVNPCDAVLAACTTAGTSSCT